MRRCSQFMPSRLMVGMSRSKWGTHTVSGIKWGVLALSVIPHTGLIMGGGITTRSTNNVALLSHLISRPKWLLTCSVKMNLKRIPLQQKGTLFFFSFTLQSNTSKQLYPCIGTVSTDPFWQNMLGTKTRYVAKVPTTTFHSGVLTRQTDKEHLLNSTFQAGDGILQPR